MELVLHFDMARSFTRFLAVVLLCLPVCTRAQQMILYAMPSPRPLNWRSPHTLFMSYMENLLVHTGYPNHRHPMGHLLVELRDTAHYALVGAVAQSRAEMFNSVTHEHYGLGALFTTFKGKVETEADNYHQLVDRYLKGDIAYIKFLVNEKTFTRLWQYLQEYKERGYDKRYNGHNKPREGKGAGCSAFAVSFIELAGLLDTVTLRLWQVKVNVQDKLIGGPEGADKRISILKMAFTQRWADTGRHAYKALTYYEPRYVYEWIGRAWSDPAANIKYGIQCRGKAKGLVVDCRNQHSPDGSIWLTP